MPRQNEPTNAGNGPGGRECGFPRRVQYDEPEEEEALESQLNEPRRMRAHPFRCLRFSRIEIGNFSHLGDLPRLVWIAKRMIGIRPDGTDVVIEQRMAEVVVADL